MEIEGSLVSENWPVCEPWLQEIFSDWFQGLRHSLSEKHSGTTLKSKLLRNGLLEFVALMNSHELADSKGKVAVIANVIELLLCQNKNSVSFVHLEVPLESHCPWFRGFLENDPKNYGPFLKEFKLLNGNLERDISKIEECLKSYSLKRSSSETHIESMAARFQKDM